MASQVLGNAVVHTLGSGHRSQHTNAETLLTGEEPCLRSATRIPFAWAPGAQPGQPTTLEKGGRGWRAHLGELQLAGLGERAQQGGVAHEEHEHAASHAFHERARKAARRARRRRAELAEVLHPAQGPSESGPRQCACVGGSRRGARTGDCCRLQCAQAATRLALRCLWPSWGPLGTHHCALSCAQTAHARCLPARVVPTACTGSCGASVQRGHPSRGSLLDTRAALSAACAPSEGEGGGGQRAPAVRQVAREVGHVGRGGARRRARRRRPSPARACAAGPPRPRRRPCGTGAAPPPPPRPAPPPWEPWGAPAGRGEHLSSKDRLAGDGLVGEPCHGSGPPEGQLLTPGHIWQGAASTGPAQHCGALHHPGAGLVWPWDRLERSQVQQLRTHAQHGPPRSPAHALMGSIACPAPLTPRRPAAAGWDQGEGACGLWGSEYRH